MVQILRSELELVVKSGFIYFPLPLDPDISKEVPRKADRTLLEQNGRLFIRSLSLKSLLENFEKMNGYSDADADSPETGDLSESAALLPGGSLRTIVLRIMPYFIRMNRGLRRKRPSDEEVLDSIWRRIEIPPEFLEKAEGFLDSRPLLERLTTIENRSAKVLPPPNGPLSGVMLAEWLGKVLDARRSERERSRLVREIRKRQGLGRSKKNHVAVLLYLSETGTFELDGFGFIRIGRGDEYLVYKRTGKYVLRDYYGREYHFPDCRVAVPADGPWRPFVLEFYKHPLLFGHAANQEICLGDYEYPNEFSPAAIIRLLEDGVNTLLYGYDPRRRNGHHSLDSTMHYIKSIEFEDYRV